MRIFTVLRDLLRLASSPGRRVDPRLEELRRGNEALAAALAAARARTAALDARALDLLRSAAAEAEAQRGALEAETAAIAQGVELLGDNAQRQLEAAARHNVLEDAVRRVDGAAEAAARTTGAADDLISLKAVRPPLQP